MRRKALILLRWIKMLRGKSVFHINQSEGRLYLKGEIRGYYSDLRHKVTGDIIIDDFMKVPVNVSDNGNKIYFPIAIFQYGLGAFDLYLETGDKSFLDKFINSVKWALDNQCEDGSWDNFGWVFPSARYSSMAQAEGASLLCRAYSEWRDKRYLNAAQLAIDFMLVPVEDGGTTSYTDSGGVTFEERAGRRTILNGMIFSIWGLYDLTLLIGDDRYTDILARSINHLCILLPDYDRGYWSDYDLDGNIASKFYHKLHIEQLKTLSNLFGKEAFNEYISRWECYTKSFINPKRAFIIKAIQKIRVIDSEVTIIK